MARRAKLKDIAEALGISITTVSRAINDKSDIKLETKEAVLAKVAELNYQPNNLAVSLRRSNTLNLVGVVIPFVKHYFFSTLLEGIMDQAHRFNYFVILGESLHDSDKEQKILADFIQHGVGGILLAPCKHSDFDKNVLPIIRRRLPVVIMDRMYDSYKGCYINNDDFRGGYDAVTHLIECGYQRIAHISSSDSWSIGHDRKEGYRTALQEHGFDLDPNYIHICNFNNKEEGEEEGYLATHMLMSLKNPPDAIFSVTDDIALGVYKYAKEHDINIPNDLGIVGFSNSELSQYLTPPLTTMEQYGYQIGSDAFKFFLKAKMEDGGIFQKTLRPKLIERASTISKRK